MSKKRKNWVRALETSTCFVRRCKRTIEPGDRCTIIGTDRGPGLIHARHVVKLNLLGRFRLFGAGPPGLSIYRGPLVEWLGHYSLGLNEILLPAQYGDLSIVQRVYVLAHETVHWVLCRDIGLVPSMQLDGIIHLPLRCFEGRSLYQYELNSLHEASYH